MAEGDNIRNRQGAIERAAAYFDDGGFVEDLARRIAIPSTSQDPDFRDDCRRYLAEEIADSLAALGFRSQVHDNPEPGGGPILIAERHEGDDVPTVLSYGHGDTVRGQDASWRDGLAPWSLIQEGERLYGRGTADNKGQHSILIAGLKAVLAERGRLGFNAKIMIETSEETGSSGLAAFARRHKDALAADVLIASDGPRLQPDLATVFMGARGALNFNLAIDSRPGAHHSGNWGGLLSNPGIVLAHAIASLVGRHGESRVPALVPEAIPPAVRDALAGLEVGGGDEAPAIDPDWGEPGLSQAEKVFAWNTFEVLAFRTGDPDKVVNAIPGAAIAWCQIRFTVDRDPASFLPAIREHLAAHGFPEVEVSRANDDVMMNATRLDPADPWARWAVDSVARTIGAPPAVLPNLGGSLPNDVFAEILGLPTIWIPHSYAGCNQHAPNEHMLTGIAREGLRIMAGLFWDLGAGDTP